MKEILFTHRTNQITETYPIFFIKHAREKQDKSIAFLETALLTRTTRIFSRRKKENKFFSPLYHEGINSQHAFLD